MKEDILNSIVKKTGIQNLFGILINKISFSELQSLLVYIFENKTKQLNFSDLYKNYKTSRFLKPSDIDPILHRKIELEIFSLLPENYEILDLSTLAPLGTSSVLTTVHQNNIVTTIRNNEVAADTTNMLAFECAKRREEILKQDKKSAQRVNFCSSQRLTRAQAFENKNFSAHFCVVALCSAGKDEGNISFEKSTLIEHLEFYFKILENFIDKKKIRNLYLKIFDYRENVELIDIIKSQLQNRNIEIIINNNSDYGRNYYKCLRFMAGAKGLHDEEYDFVDGGFTDWTAKLLNNKKERLLTSGLGLDYLIRAMNPQI